METIDELVDLEEYATAGKKPPKAKSYRIRIDKTQYVVHVSSMTGRQLLELAQKLPVEQYEIRQRVHGQLLLIALDDSVDFTQPGIERFVTLPLDPTEG